MLPCGLFLLGPALWEVKGHPLSPERSVSSCCHKQETGSLSAPSGGPVWDRPEAPLASVVTATVPPDPPRRRPLAAAAPPQPLAASELMQLVWDTFQQRWCKPR